MKLIASIILGVIITAIVIAIVYFMMIIGWVLVAITVVGIISCFIYTGLQKVSTNGNKKKGP